MTGVCHVLQTIDIINHIFEFTHTSITKIKLVNKLFYRASKNIQTTVNICSCGDISVLSHFKNHKRVFVNINFCLKNDLLLTVILENQNICGISVLLENNVNPFRYYPSSAFDKITTLQLDVSNFNGLVRFISKFKKMEYFRIISSNDINGRVKCNLNNCPQIREIYCNSVNPRVYCVNSVNNIETIICDFNKYVVKFNGECMLDGVKRIFYIGRINMLSNDIRSKNLFMYTNSIVFTCDTLNAIEHLTILPLHSILESSLSCVNAPNLKSLETCDRFKTIFLVKCRLLHLKIICFENTINVERIGMMLASYRPKTIEVVVKHAIYPGKAFKHLFEIYNMKVTLINPTRSWNDFRNRSSICM